MYDVPAIIASSPVTWAEAATALRTRNLWLLLCYCMGFAVYQLARENVS